MVVPVVVVVVVMRLVMVVPVVVIAVLPEASAVVFHYVRRIERYMIYRDLLSRVVSW